MGPTDTAATGAPAPPDGARPADGGTRARILDAALELFASEGVAGTTVTQIERRSGLSAGSGSLYRHFRSKEDVFEATLVREVERLRSFSAEERARLPYLPERRSRLTLTFHQCLVDIGRFDRLLQLVLREQERLPHLNELIAQVLGLDRGLDEWAGGEGAGRPADLDAMTTAIAVSALVGYHTVSRFNDNGFMGVGPEQFVEQLVELTVGPS